MKTIALAVVCLAFGGALRAHADAQDTLKRVLKKMEGCYEVTYAYSDGKKQKTLDTNRELAIFVDEGAGKFLIKRYFEADLPKGGQIVIRHWRERWDTSVDNKWHQVVLAPNGKDVRYECTSVPDIKDLGKPGEYAMRSCEAAGAEIPNRLKGTKDLDHLDRTGVQHITATWWSDQQKNIGRDKDDVALFDEVGLNHYRKMKDEEPCKKARELADKDAKEGK